MTDEEREKRIKTLDSVAALLRGLPDGIGIAQDYLRLGDEAHAHEVLYAALIGVQGIEAALKRIIGEGQAGA